MPKNFPELPPTWPVCVWFTFPYHAENTGIYIYLGKACLFPCNNRKRSILREEADLLSSRCPSPAGTASSRCSSVAGWNICFCCSKNCLFALTITHWCFPFHFSSLSKSHYPFSGLSRLWIFSNSIRAPVESWCTHQLWSFHPWHLGGGVLQEACSVAVSLLPGACVG